MLLWTPVRELAVLLRAGNGASHLKENALKKAESSICSGPASAVATLFGMADSFQASLQQARPFFTSCLEFWPDTQRRGGHTFVFCTMSLKLKIALDCT